MLLLLLPLSFRVGFIAEGPADSANPNNGEVDIAVVFRGTITQDEWVQVSSPWALGRLASCCEHNGTLCEIIFEEKLSNLSWVQLLVLLYVHTRTYLLLHRHHNTSCCLPEYVTLQRPSFGVPGWPIGLWSPGLLPCRGVPAQLKSLPGKYGPSNSKQ